MKKKTLIVFSLWLVLIVPSFTVGQSADFKIIADITYVDFETPNDLLVFTLPEDYDAEGEQYLSMTFNGSLGNTGELAVFANPVWPQPEAPLCSFSIDNPNVEHRIFLIIGGFFLDLDKKVIYKQSPFRPGINRILLCLKGTRNESAGVDKIILHYHRKL